MKGGGVRQKLVTILVTMTVIFPVTKYRGRTSTSSIRNNDSYVSIQNSFTVSRYEVRLRSNETIAYVEFGICGKKNNLSYS